MGRVGVGGRIGMRIIAGMKAGYLPVHKWDAGLNSHNSHPKMVILI
jgi:hypothetical protein